MIDIGKALKITVKKGKVKIGTRQTKLNINNGTAKLIVIANNCPHSSEIIKLSKKKKIPIYDYNSNSIDLGYACGKAYAVSVFAVLDEGGSNIMQLVEKR
jgi:large subunit ribosomal protein L30e